MAKRKLTMEELKESVVVDIPPTITLGWVKEILAICALTPDYGFLSPSPARVSALKGLAEILKEEGSIVLEEDSLDTKIQKIKNLLQKLNLEGK